jgi:hypothetical protein
LKGFSSQKCVFLGSKTIIHIEVRKDRRGLRFGKFRELTRKKVNTVETDLRSIPRCNLLLLDTGRQNSFTAPTKATNVEGMNGTTSRCSTGAEATSHRRNNRRQRRKLEFDTDSGEVNVKSLPNREFRRKTREQFGDAFKPDKEPAIENEATERSIRPSTREQFYRYEEPVEDSPTPITNSRKQKGRKSGGTLRIRSLGS